MPKFTTVGYNPSFPEALHFLIRMSWKTDWIFGQVPAAIAELAHNLPTFLQADFENSALGLSLLMSYIYIYGVPSIARNLTYIHIYGRDILLGILVLEPCISLIYA
jgi:hypothetical protein